MMLFFAVFLIKSAIYCSVWISPWNLLFAFIFWWVLAC